VCREGSDPIFKDEVNAKLIPYLRHKPEK